jgi:chromate transport protein ChrA
MNARTRERANARTIGRNAWQLGMLGLALLIGQLPHLIAACCAPRGATGVGTAWFVNDFAQYESAMRQGAEQSSWLIRDVFTAEPHQASFMFPLYVGLGKLGSTLHLPAVGLEHGLEVLARGLLVLALWRFCRAFASGRRAARWAFCLALFAGGFEVFGALIGGYAGNWSYETNGFGLLFAAPHVPLGMAATLELARDGLRPRRRRLTLSWLAKIALLSGVLALLHPFHVPVLLGALLLAGLIFWRTGRDVLNLLGAVVACLAAMPALLPTVARFSLDPFWVATYSLQNVLPSPAPHELLIDLGPIFVLALGGALMLRARVAPFGLLLWLLLGLVAMYLPVPYQRRLGFGIQPAFAVLAANALVAASAALSARRASILRMTVVAAASSGTLLVLVSVVSSGFVDKPLAIYRSTTDLDVAAAWLDTHAQPDDVILANWQTSNYLAPRTPARVFGGHPVATLHVSEKQFAASSVFVHSSSLVVAASLGANWLVYGPEESTLQGPPAPTFQSGDVRVYRIDQ